ncbi:MAG: hypothetical protein ACHQXJ_01640 [Nitrososphaerales archaeon]
MGCAEFNGVKLMTNYPYTDNIPFASDNPSNDQPNMQTNTNSIDNLINEDHYSFNQNNGGFHKQVRMVDLLSIPVSLIASSGTLYTKNYQSDDQLFYTDNTTGNEYQLSRCDTNATNFLSFGTNNSYVSVPVQNGISGGWTFLPGNGGNTGTPLAATGGLILQWGGFNATTGSNAFTFPRTFTNKPFNFIITPVSSSSGSERTTFGWKSISNSGATIVINTTAVGLTAVYWQAIGI